MDSELLNALNRIADELHTMNVINAERNKAIYYCIPYADRQLVNPIQFSRKYAKSEVK